MENNKHSKFESLIKNQFDNHDVDYNNDDWLDFEKKFGNQLPSKKSKRGDLLNKIDLKSLLIISSLITNILIILFFIFYIYNEKVCLSKSIVTEIQNPLKRNIYIIDTIVKIDSEINTREIAFLTNKFFELENALFASEISENIKNDNSKISENSTITIIDTIYSEKKDDKYAVSDKIIKYQADTVGVYSIVSVEKKPLFKDNRGKYHFIEDLPDYICSEYKPSNVGKNVSGEYSVYLMFTITKNGEIENVQKLRTSNSRIEDEAIRILEGMSPWIPGKIDESPVDVVTSITIEIEIKENSPFPNF